MASRTGIFSPFQARAIGARRDDLIADFPMRSLEAGLEVSWRRSAIGVYERWLDLLKERTIGIDVFGRSTSYEPSDDATVRVKAGDVRKRLSIYYAEQGARDPVRIELPAGTYVPEFRRADHPDAGHER